uniref:SFRICE_012498 n=1 Tax=Spodoptera frugiperda TaxID=7108 RepID=A0A2H1VFN1_SPOFR
MSAIAQQKVLVKEGLFQFITKHIPSADINVIDDIVLTYVISILEEASQDPCFDVEDSYMIYEELTKMVAKIGRIPTSGFRIRLLVRIRFDRKPESQLEPFGFQTLVVEHHHHIRRDSGHAINCKKIELSESDI